MFRVQYDTDVTVWSPEGKLCQVDYAMEAVKQGSCTAGAVSKTHVVIVATKRSPDRTISEHLSKMFRIDNHLGISIAGLTPDARVLARHMRTESMNHRFRFNAPAAVERVVRRIADKAQSHTQGHGKRPYGVGLLVGGFDETGPHLIQTCPSGNYYDFRATAIGARCQGARSRFEQTYKRDIEGKDISLDELRMYCLRALAATVPEDGSLEAASTALLEVGLDTPLKIYDSEEDMQGFIDAHLAAKAAEAAAAEAAAGGDDDGDDGAPGGDVAMAPPQENPLPVNDGH